MVFQFEHMDLDSDPAGHPRATVQSPGSWPT